VFVSLKKVIKASPVTAFKGGLGFTHKVIVYIGVRESLRLFAHPQKTKIN
jgi:hypothetical protein